MAVACLHGAHGADYRPVAGSRQAVSRTGWRNSGNRHRRACGDVWRVGGLLRWAAGPRPLALAARGLPAAAAVYGLMLEGVQNGLKSAGRTGSWLDAWANLAGIVFGWWLADWMMNKARME